jgi:methionyl aminopeptidase
MSRALICLQIGIYGYGRNSNISAKHLSLSASAKSLLRTIDANFGTIVFNARYLERLGVKRYHLDVSFQLPNLFSFTTSIVKH